MNIAAPTPVKRFIPAVLWFLLIVVLLCLPGSAFPPTPELNLIHFDKIVHCGLFCMLVFLWFRPLIKTKRSATDKKKWIIYIALLAILFGTIMEFVQKYWIPNRSFDLFDIVADSAGSLLPVLFFRKLLQLMNKPANVAD